MPSVITNIVRDIIYASCYWLDILYSIVELFFSTFSRASNSSCMFTSYRQTIIIDKLDIFPLLNCTILLRNCKIAKSFVLFGCIFYLLMCLHWFNNDVLLMKHISNSNMNTMWASSFWAWLQWTKRQKRHHLLFEIYIFPNGRRMHRTITIANIHSLTYTCTHNHTLDKI